MTEDRRPLTLHPLPMECRNGEREIDHTRIGIST